MKKNIQIGLFILLGGMGLAGYQLYTFQAEEVPKMEDARQKKNIALNAKVEELRNLQSFASNIENVKQELKELNLQFESLLEYMPRTFNLSGLLRKLTMLAKNSGVKMGTFRPSKSEEKGPEGFYAMTTIGFELKGSFAQTLVFLDQLSRLKRIVNVQTIKINYVTDSSAAGVAASSTPGNGPVIASTVASVKTYRFSE